MKKILLFSILCLLIGKTYGQKKSQPIRNINAQELIYMLSYGIPKDAVERYGFMNWKEEEIIKPIFQNASDFYGDYANIIQDSVYGYVDIKGKTKLFPQFDEVYWLYSPIGLAKKNNLYGLVSRNGQIVAETIYKRISLPSEGYFATQIDGKNNYLNEKGEKVFPDSVSLKGFPIYDKMAIFYGFNVKSDDSQKLMGLIDVKGRVIIKPIYEDLSGYFTDGLMRAKYHGKYGYINEKGEVIIPFEYQDVRYTFSSKMTTAMLNGKWGMIGLKNEVIIPFEYNFLNSFCDGLAFAIKDKKAGYIDLKNNVKIPFENDHIWNGDFSEQVAVVKRNNKYGFINKKGKIIIEPIYETALPFKNGKAYVKLNGKSGFIWKDGKEIIPIVYNTVSDRSALIKFVK